MWCTFFIYVAEAALHVSVYTRRNKTMRKKGKEGFTTGHKHGDERARGVQTDECAKTMDHARIFAKDTQKKSAFCSDTSTWHQQQHIILIISVHHQRVRAEYKAKDLSQSSILSPIPDERIGKPVRMQPAWHGRRAGCVTREGAILFIFKFLHAYQIQLFVFLFDVLKLLLRLRF